MAGDFGKPPDPGVPIGPRPGNAGPARGPHDDDGRLRSARAGAPRRDPARFRARHIAAGLVPYPATSGVTCP